FRRFLVRGERRQTGLWELTFPPVGLRIRIEVRDQSCWDRRPHGTGIVLRSVWRFMRGHRALDRFGVVGERYHRGLYGGGRILLLEPIHERFHRRIVYIPQVERDILLRHRGRDVRSIDLAIATRPRRGTRRQ